MSQPDKRPVPSSKDLRDLVQIWFYGTNDERRSLANVYGEPIGVWKVGEITDFSNVFRYVDITDEDLSGWDMSNAISTIGMFYNASGFVGNGLDEWDVSSLMYASNMFAHVTEFQANLTEWDVGKVTEFSYMFHGAEKFNGNITEWNTESGTNFQGMFKGAKSFSQNISKWDLAEAIDTSMMFEGCSEFDSDLSGWNLQAVKTMKAMFNEAEKFNQDLTKWDVTDVKDASQMFRYTSLDHDYCEWTYQLGNETNVGRMFFGTQCDVQADPRVSNDTDGKRCGPLCYDCGCESPGSGAFSTTTTSIAPTLTLVVGLLSYLFG